MSAEIRGSRLVLTRKIPASGTPISTKSILSVLSDGGDVSDFEVEFSNRFDIDGAVAVSSGRAALTVTLKLLSSIRNGKKVILPAYISPAVPIAVRNAGLKPVMCDIEENGVNLDPARIEEKLGDDTLAVIPAHLFGIPCSIKRIQDICGDIPVIENVAQGMGLKIDGKPAGSFGDFSVFSFGRGKNVTAMGGGIIGIGRYGGAELAEEHLHDFLNPARSCEGGKALIQLLAYSIFVRPELFWVVDKSPVGPSDSEYPGEYPLRRLDSIRARYAVRMLEELGNVNRERVEIARALSSKIEQSIPSSEKISSGILRLPLLFEKQERRDYTLKKLKQSGISASKMATYSHEVEPCHPNARIAADRLLALPLFPGMNREEIMRVIEII